MNKDDMDEIKRNIAAAFERALEGNVQSHRQNIETGNDNGYDKQRDIELRILINDTLPLGWSKKEEDEQE